MSDDWDFSRPSSSSSSFGAPSTGATSSPASPSPWPASNNSPHNSSGGDPFGPTQTPFGDPFAAPNALGTPAVPTSGTGPPFLWLAVAALAALAGLAIAALDLTGGAVYITGWVSAGPLAVSLLTVFVRLDTSRQAALYYSYPTWKPLAYRAVLVLCLVAVVAAALRIGDWAGHL